MIKKNGLIFSNRPKHKNVTDILPNPPAKISESIPDSSLTTAVVAASESKTSANGKVGSYTAFTDSIRVVVQEATSRPLKAQNPQIPITAVEKLASDEVDAVRSPVAEHPNSPASVLEKLAGDGYEGVRSLVALHPQTPITVLERLARDWCSNVRHRVAEHPKTSTSALERLASDKCENIRWRGAKNPNTSASILEKLASDEYDRVGIEVA